MSMRIHSSSQSNTVTNGPTAPDSSAVSFENTLGNVQKLQQRELEAFIYKLDAQAQKLKDSLSLRDLTTFREMIKKFLRSTLGVSRNMQDETCWDYRGNSKVMSRVTRIDQVLEDLGRKVLDQNTKSVDLLAMIDEIRGLIIDLHA